MAQKVDCPCGESVRGEDDDELVANVEQHIGDKHPDMVGTMSREQILGMAVEA
jgi:predicted small metal-binding protein